MKIKYDHLQTLDKGIWQAVSALAEQENFGSFESILDHYKNNMKAKDINKRFRWDMLYNAKKFLPEHFLTDILYEYLDDTHIDTALKSHVFRGIKI